MQFARSSGTLLHPTSLPGPHGIGDLGPGAHHFVDFLHASGQKLWQVLPLNPTGYGDSPFQCFSAHAGNPLLISLERLIEVGILEPGEVRDESDSTAERVDFGSVIRSKLPLLKKAADRFLKS